MIILFNIHDFISLMSGYLSTINVHNFDCIYIYINDVLIIVNFTLKIQMEKVHGVS